MKRRYIVDPDTGRLIEVERSAPRPRIYIQGDTIEPMRSMASGRHFTSKSRYYADVKARGYEIVGNEKAEIMRQPELKVVDARPELYQTASERGLSL